MSGGVGDDGMVVGAAVVGMVGVAEVEAAVMLKSVCCDGSSES